jgi:hypothetical protein
VGRSGFVNGPVLAMTRYKNFENGTVISVPLPALTYYKPANLIKLFFVKYKKMTRLTRHDPSRSALGPPVLTREGRIRGGPTRIGSEFSNFGPLKSVPPHP